MPEESKPCTVCAEYRDVVYTLRVNLRIITSAPAQLPRGAWPGRGRRLGAGSRACRRWTRPWTLGTADGGRSRAGAQENAH